MKGSVEASEAEIIVMLTAKRAKRKVSFILSAFINARCLAARGPPQPTTYVTTLTVQIAFAQRVD
jgi:hypothetical protein